MSNRLLIILVLILLVVSAFAQGHYYRDGAGHAAYWTEHSVQNIRAEVVDSVASESTKLLGTFGIGGNAASGYTVLTRNFHWPYTRSGQNFVLYLDGTYFTNGNYVSYSMCGSSHPHISLDSMYFVSSDTNRATDGELMIESHWRIGIGTGYIDVYQELKPETLAIRDSVVVGLIRIKYRI